MKQFLLVALASIVMAACHKKPPPPVGMRLKVSSGEVRWGAQILPEPGDRLTEFLQELFSAGRIEPLVRADFTRQVTGHRMGGTFSVLVQTGYSADSTLEFNIAGPTGRDFVLTLPTCCDPVHFEPFCDEWGEGAAGTLDGTSYLEFDMGLHEGEFTSGGEPLEPEELILMLMHRRQQAQEVMVHISIGSDDIAGDLLPLLAASQNLEMHINIGAEQREAEDRKQRRVAMPFINPAPRHWTGKCSGPFALPNVASNIVMPAPPLLPQRWFMSCPDSQELIRYLVAGHGRG